MYDNHNSPVTNCDSSGKGRSHLTTEQSHLFGFDSSSNFPTISEPLTTSAQGPGFTLNPFYSCRCRRGYTLSTDPHNNFKRQIEPTDYSRKDIARSYRVGFRGGF